MGTSELGSALRPGHEYYLSLSTMGKGKGDEEQGDDEPLNVAIGNKDLSW